MIGRIDFTVPMLGTPHVPSPLRRAEDKGVFARQFVADGQYVIYDIRAASDMMQRTFSPEELLEQAGPREKIYFDPTKVHAAIVTCGGLCPGLNDVIRAIVMGLWYLYGVRRITGIRYGYRGLLAEYGIPTMNLDPAVVTNVHHHGGSILGNSRGGGDKIAQIVDTIEQMNLNMLFTIGGDGTQSGALKIAEEAERRGLKLALVGIPKTIDNDLSFIQKSFGFETAVSKAVEAVTAAHTEANDAINGIGLVKVMGRQSGFIAAHTALATSDVNYVLVPEMPFDLDGANGLLAHLQQRLQKRNHAVILTAEGAGQDLLAASGECDASGNVKLNDIGVFLMERIQQYFKQQKIEVSMKYIDPSYIIRAEPAIPNDSIYCARLAHNAVHAAMAGKTKMLISLVNNRYVHLPINMAISRRNQVDPRGPLWRDVIAATGQPWIMKNDPDIMQKLGDTEVRPDSE